MKYLLLIMIACLTVSCAQKEEDHAQEIAEQEAEAMKDIVEQSKENLKTQRFEFK